MSQSIYFVKGVGSFGLVVDFFFVVVGHIFIGQF
jgi:hypothetical protein